MTSPLRMGRRGGRLFSFMFSDFAFDQGTFFQVGLASILAALRFLRLSLRPEASPFIYSARDGVLLSSAGRTMCLSVLNNHGG